MGIGGGDFALGFRVDAADAERGTAKGGGHHHFPYARPLRTGWRQGADAEWEHAGEDPDLWEVVCAECGDTGGPLEQQSEAVQRLRGPYRSRHHARHVATTHFDAG